MYLQVALWIFLLDWHYFKEIYLINNFAFISPIFQQDRTDFWRVIHMTESRWPNEYYQIGENDWKVDNDQS